MKQWLLEVIQLTVQASRALWVIADTAGAQWRASAIEVARVRATTASG